VRAHYIFVDLQAPSIMLDSSCLGLADGDPNIQWPQNPLPQRTAGLETLWLVQVTLLPPPPSVALPKALQMIARSLCDGFRDPIRRSAGDFSCQRDPFFPFYDPSPSRKTAIGDLHALTLHTAPR